MCFLKDIMMMDLSMFGLGLFFFSRFHQVCIHTTRNGISCTFGSDSSLESSLLWCFSHLDLWIFCHSSLQSLLLSDSVWLDVTVDEQPFSGISRDVQLGSSPGSGCATRGLSQSFPSCVVLTVCLGSLSCWKVNLRPGLRSWVLWTRFSLRISLYFALFSFPSVLTSPPSLLLENPHDDKLWSFNHCHGNQGLSVFECWGFLLYMHYPPNHK